MFSGTFLILYANSFKSIDLFFKENFLKMSIFLPFALLYRRKFVFINNVIINKLFAFNKQMTKRFIFFSLYKLLLFFVKSLSTM